MGRPHRARQRARLELLLVLLLALAAGRAGGRKSLVWLQHAARKWRVPAYCFVLC
jgi:hypothetical protein